MTKEISILPSESEFSMMKQMSDICLKSRMNPSGLTTYEATMFIMLKGREVGVSPLVSIAHIHIIQGKPTLSAELMLAAIYTFHPTAEIYFEKNDLKCVLRAKRPNEKEFSTFTWTIERAKKMGLDKKDNWIKQPENMLFWRCITEMKRAKFPEVLMGISYFREELEDEGLKEMASPLDEAEVEKVLEKKPLPNFAPQAAVDVVEKIQGYVKDEDAPLAEPTLSEEERICLMLRDEIKVQLKRLKWNKDTIVEAVVNNFNGKTSAQLNRAELNEFLNLLMES